MIFLNASYEKQITCLYRDSIKYDLIKYYEKTGMLCIDGGHNLKICSSDTKNAFNILPKYGLSCIIWHDYKNSNQSYKVTYFLDKLAKGYNLYYIEERVLFFSLNDTSNKLVEKLN